MLSGGTMCHSLKTTPRPFLHCLLSTFLTHWNILSNIFFLLPHHNSPLSFPSVCLQMSIIPLSPCVLGGGSHVWNVWSPGNLEVMLYLIASSPVRQEKASFMLVSATSYLYILLSPVIRFAQTTCSQTFIKPSFVLCLPPPTSLSLLHFISLHPILCVWAKGSDSVQARLFLRRLQHHLPLLGERGHPRQPAHRWRNSHHGPNGKTMTQCWVLKETYHAHFPQIKIVS